MPYINDVTLMGHLTKDPEMRITPSGRSVTSFSIATSYGSGDGKRTEFHNCVIWNAKIPWAEQANEMNKGDLVLARGSLQTRQWEDKQGNTRRTTEILCREVHWLRSPKGDGTTNPRNATDPKKQSFQNSRLSELLRDIELGEPKVSGVDPDEIPF
jgi:single-strand DNA-binding protein